MKTLKSISSRFFFLCFFAGLGLLHATEEPVPEPTSDPSEQNINQMIEQIAGIRTVLDDLIGLPKGTFKIRAFENRKREKPTTHTKFKKGLKALKDNWNTYEAQLMELLEQRRATLIDTELRNFKTFASNMKQDMLMFDCELKKHLDAANKCKKERKKQKGNSKKEEEVYRAWMEEKNKTLTPNHVWQAVNLADPNSTPNKKGVRKILQKNAFKTSIHDIGEKAPIWYETFTTNTSVSEDMVAQLRITAETFAMDSLDTKGKNGKKYGREQYVKAIIKRNPDISSSLQGGDGAVKADNRVLRNTIAGKDVQIKALRKENQELKTQENVSTSTGGVDYLALRKVVGELDELSKPIKKITDSDKKGDGGGAERNALIASLVALLGLTSYTVGSKKSKPRKEKIETDVEKELYDEEEEPAPVAVEG